MTDTRATLGVDLHLEPKGPRLRKGLTDALRDAVRSGRLASGTRLPSSRSLAADLGIARNTVADAYRDLVAEGWLTARQGSGTQVAERALPRTPAPVPRRRPAAGPRYSLLPGSPDLASFPRTGWLKAARRAVLSMPSTALGHGDTYGRVELRTALADYLARARGVRVDPDRVLVCAGFAHGLAVLAALLRQRGAREVAVESYGLDLYWDKFRAAGLRTRPLPLDGRGACTGVLDGWGTGVRDGRGPAAVLLTPAHQFPTGVPLHPDRRAAVVDWARRTGGLILEDDYDGEFRYDRQPVGALQGLDPDRVVYFGTASKALAPGLRLGWMVLPGRLTDRAAETASDLGRTCGVLDQLTLAEFLASGAYDRHVRAMRLRYRRRRDELVAALAERVPGVRVGGIAAGLNAVLELPPGAEQSVLRTAAWHGLAVEGLSRFRHGDAGGHAGAQRPAGESPGGPGDALVVGFGTPPDHAWGGAVDALCAALCAAGPGLCEGAPTAVPAVPAVPGTAAAAGTRAASATAATAVRM